MIHTRCFPPRGYYAITLFPFVFYKGRPLNRRELRHETVHLWQQLTLLVVLFYLLYGLFWLWGLLRYRSGDKAYRAIPFERSAYRLEARETLGWREMAFDWIRCLREDNGGGSGELEAQ